MTQKELVQYVKAVDFYAVIKRLEARIDALSKQLTSTSSTSSSTSSQELSSLDINTLISNNFD